MAVIPPVRTGYRQTALAMMILPESFRRGKLQSQPNGFTFHCIQPGNTVVTIDRL